MVFDPHFFVAGKPSPMRQTCTVVNFDNLDAHKGLFSSLGFEWMESSDWCWFVVKKKTFFREIQTSVVNRMFMQTTESTSWANIVLL